MSPLNISSFLSAFCYSSPIYNFSNLILTLLLLFFLSFAISLIICCISCLLVNISFPHSFNVLLLTSKSLFRCIRSWFPNYYLPNNKSNYTSPYIFVIILTTNLIKITFSVAKNLSTIFESAHTVDGHG